jgi:membrane protein required for colicin V production
LPWAGDDVVTAFDVAVVAVIALSVLFGYLRGIVRSLIGLAAWVLGFVLAIGFAPAIATVLPAFPEAPLLPQALAFVLVFVLAIVAGALVAWPLHSVIHKAGLGFVDRGLGGLFGMARGAVLVLAFVLVAGLSALPSRDWWQNSSFASPFEEAALSLRPWLPPQWAQRLAYPDRRTAPAPRKV